MAPEAKKWSQIDILKMLMLASDVEALIPDNAVNSLGIFALRRRHCLFSAMLILILQVRTE